ncbi:MAG: arginase [Trueperaceae bacterium]
MSSTADRYEAPGTSRDVRILGVPMDLGAGRRGVDMGPSALRVARLARALRQLGHEVTDLGNVETEVPEASSAASADPGDQLVDGTSADAGTPGLMHYPHAIAAACRAAYERLSALPATAFALALGGDHSISMGTVAGVTRGQRTGVVWVDAHADLNTPTTSPSGNVHGMPMAHLLGLGAPLFHDMWGGGAAIQPSDVVYVGLRSVDPGERELIHDLGIRYFSMKEIDELGIAHVAAETIERLSGLPRVHVSFDADALDPSLAPGVGTPIKGGLTLREAFLLMELFAESEMVTSLDLVEVNPMLDRGNQTAETMVDMAASLLGKRIL